MTDTNQVLRLVSRMQMHRLGADRIAGAPCAVPLAPEAMNAARVACAREGVPVMIFAGNRGCIRIHSGQIETLKEMGPWQNLRDPRSKLHLRRDHVAEVSPARTPTRRGPVLSIEAFTAEGARILQLFGYRKAGQAETDAFARMAAPLPRRGGQA